MSISAKPKKRGRGRPATGRDPMIGLRLSKADTARLDKWAKGYGYTRSEAIRALIRAGKVAVNRRKRRSESSESVEGELDEDESVEDELDDTPENYRLAFLLRVDAAHKFAVYTGPMITDEMIASARAVAAKWEKLAQVMEDRRRRSTKRLGARKRSD